MEGTFNAQRLTFNVQRRDGPGGGSGFYEDGGADFDELEEEFGVPIGEAEAAVGFGAADVLGTGCAVDAVAGAVEADPDGADGIVGAGLEGQLAVELTGFLGFGKDFGVEKVGGVGGGTGDVEFADGALFGELGDAAGEVGDEVGAGVVNFELTVGEKDAEVGGFVAEVGRGDVGDLEFGAGGDGAPVDGGVEVADEGGVGLEFFGDEFEGIFVVEAVLLGFAEPVGAEGAEAVEVLGFKGVGGEEGGVEGEAVEGGGVEFASDREIFEALKVANGGAGLAADAAVNGAGGDAAAGEGDLGFEGSEGRTGGVGGRGGRRGVGVGWMDDEPDAGGGRRVGLGGDRVEIGGDDDAWWRDLAAVGDGGIDAGDDGCGGAVGWEGRRRGRVGARGAGA